MKKSIKVLNTHALTANKKNNKVEDNINLQACEWSSGPCSDNPGWSSGWSSATC
jgi:hypothetical protein